MADDMSESLSGKALSLAPYGSERGGLPESEARAARVLRQGHLRQALEILMNSYGAAVYRYCLGQLGDRARAEDILQTTFVEAYRSLKGFAGRSTFRTWLIGIARHKCLDDIRRRGRENRVLREVASSGTAGMDQGLDVRANMESREMAGILRRCLEKLDARKREAVLLRYQSDLSYVEMAAMCQEQAATLQARVARILPELRRCVEAGGVFP